MNTLRLAYEDPSTPAEMAADGLAVQATLTRPLTAAVRDLSREQSKRDIEISEAAARLAGAMNLQLDGDS